MHLHIINPLDLLVQQTHNAPNFSRAKSYINMFSLFAAFFPPARILFVLVSRLHLLQTSPVAETLQSDHRAKPACIVGDVV